MARGINTKCLHLEEEEGCCNNYGSISFPIYQTATYEHPAVGQSTGFDYSRLQNPTREHLEKIVATLENGIDALAFSTGMAAITLVMELFKPGDHLIIDADLYGGSIRLFDNVSLKNGIHFSRIDCWKENVESYVNENTKAIYIETPANPMMNVTDIAALAEIAKRHNLLLIVDNTFLSPYFQNPLELGADIVVHSGTKFLGGHNDTLAGFLVTNREDISEKLRFLIKTTGSGLAPFDSWLILRGIKTLGIRMEQAQKNAFKIVEWLKTKSAVTRVIYPGLPEHPGYEIMKSRPEDLAPCLHSSWKAGNLPFCSGKSADDQICRKSWRCGDVDHISNYPDACGCAEEDTGTQRNYRGNPSPLCWNRGCQDLLDEFEKVFAETEEELYGGKKS